MSENDTQQEVQGQPAHLEENIVGDPAPVEQSPEPEAPPAETGEKSPDDVQQQKPPSDHVPTDAMIAERRKRQEAEREAAYMRGQLEALRQGQQQKQPSQEELERQFYADPIGFTSSVAQHAASTAVLRERQTRATISEQRARAELADYDEVIQGFYVAANNNPQLIDHLAAAPDPARWAYEYAKAQQQPQKPVDVEALKAQLRAELQAEMRKQAAASAASQTPKTQANATGAGQGAAPTDATKDPLAGLFKF